MKKFTPKMRAVYNYILAFKKQYQGHTPTHHMIMKGAGISSTSVVHYILRRLEEEGLITLVTIEDHNPMVLLKENANGNGN